MGAFSVDDAKTLMLGILQSISEAKRLPPGTEREFRYAGGMRAAVNDKEGNWWWKDEPDKLARKARGRQEPEGAAEAPAARPPKEEPAAEPEEPPVGKQLRGMKGQAYPQVRTRTASVETPSDCSRKEFFIPQERGGKCVSGADLVRDIDMMVEGVQRHKDAKEWYRESKSAMDAIFGNDATRMLALIAATSQNQALDKNIALAFDIYRASVEGTYPESLDPVTKGILGYKKPKPGEKKKYIKGIRDNVDRALSGQFRLAGPKIGEFAQALYGDEMARVIDVHMYNLFFGRPKKIWVEKTDEEGNAVVDPKTGKPEMEEKEVAYPIEYKDVAQDAVTQIADRLGWTPAETQAALWVFWLKEVQPQVEPEAAEQKKKVSAAKYRKTTATEYGKVMSTVRQTMASRNKEIKKLQRQLAKLEPDSPDAQKIQGRIAELEEKRSYTTYKDIFADLRGQLDSLRQALEKQRQKEWVETMKSLEEFPTTEETLWGHINALVEQSKEETKKVPKTPTQIKILDSIIAILKHQSTAYKNAGKLVKEIEKMQKSGEIDRLIANAGAQKQ